MKHFPKSQFSYYNILFLCVFFFNPELNIIYCFTFTVLNKNNLRESMKSQTRYLKISVWNLMILCGILYLILVWLGYKHIEGSVAQRQRLGQIFHPRISQVCMFAYVRSSGYRLKLLKSVKQ